MVLGSRASVGSPRGWASHCDICSLPEGRGTHTFMPRDLVRWARVWPWCPVWDRINALLSLVRHSENTGPTRFLLWKTKLSVQKSPNGPKELENKDGNWERTNAAEVGTDYFPGADASLTHALPHGQLQVEQRHPLGDQHDKIRNQKATCKKNTADSLQQTCNIINTMVKSLHWCPSRWLELGPVQALCL